MGRRVGSFVDPSTGETNWLDVSTVRNIKLSPMPVTRFRDQDNYRSMVEFKLGNIDMLNVITIVAEYECNNQVYRSDAHHIDELKFAEHLAEAVHAEETIDSVEFMVEMKEGAMEDLRGKLLVDRILINETKLGGAGYVYSRGKKVMTVDELVIKVNNNGSTDAYLNNCVGPIRLSNLIDPEVVFFSSDFEFRISGFDIDEETDGKIKKYELSIDDISIDDAQEDAFFKPFNLDTDNDDIISEFVMNRMEMLDNLMEDDSSLDDRFADIF